MKLKVTALENIPIRIERTLEPMGDKFVLTTLTEVGPYGSFPGECHYLVTNYRKPSLDVAIDPWFCRMMEWSMYIDTDIKQMEIPRIPSIQGVSRFDTTQWSDNNKGVRVDGDPDVFLADKGLVVPLDSFDSAAKALEVDDTFGLLLDQEEAVIGFILGDLNSDEIEVLRSSGLL